jgi:hypothetical protein
MWIYREQFQIGSGNLWCNFNVTDEVPVMRINVISQSVLAIIGSTNELPLSKVVKQIQNPC